MFRFTVVCSLLLVATAQAQQVQVQGKCRQTMTGIPNKTRANRPCIGMHTTTGVNPVQSGQLCGPRTHLATLTRQSRPLTHLMASIWLTPALTHLCVSITPIRPFTHLTASNWLTPCTHTLLSVNHAHPSTHTCHGVELAHPLYSHIARPQSRPACCPLFSHI